MKKLAHRVVGFVPLIERSAETCPSALLMVLALGLRIRPLLSKTCRSRRRTPIKSGRDFGDGGEAPAFGFDEPDGTTQVHVASPATCTRYSIFMRPWAYQCVKASPSRKETPTFSVCSRLRKYGVVFR
jgi:hypothetical protein